MYQHARIMEEVIVGGAGKLAECDHVIEHADTFGHLCFGLNLALDHVFMLSITTYTVSHALMLQLVVTCGRQPDIWLCIVLHQP